MAYQSPISTYTTEVATNIGEEFDKLVITEIAKVGVAVDKDKLVKALEYDRDQYEEGYEEGYRDGRRYKPPVITNADRIRSMSDEELAVWFYSGDFPWCVYEEDVVPCTYEDIPAHPCDRCLLDWLLQEVDDDKSGQDQRADG